VAILVHRDIGPSLFRGRACAEQGLIYYSHSAATYRETRKVLRLHFLHILGPNGYPCALITNMSGKRNSRAVEKPEDKYDEQTMFVVEKMTVRPTC